MRPKRGDYFGNCDYLGDWSDSSQNWKKLHLTWHSCVISYGFRKNHFLRRLKKINIYSLIRINGWRKGWISRNLTKRSLKSFWDFFVLHKSYPREHNFLRNLCKDLSSPSCSRSNRHTCTHLTLTGPLFRL